MHKSLSAEDLEDLDLQAYRWIQDLHLLEIHAEMGWFLWEEYKVWTSGHWLNPGRNEPRLLPTFASLSRQITENLGPFGKAAPDLIDKIRAEAGRVKTILEKPFSFLVKPNGFGNTLNWPGIHPQRQFSVTLARGHHDTAGLLPEVEAGFSAFLNQNKRQFIGKSPYPPRNPNFPGGYPVLIERVAEWALKVRTKSSQIFEERFPELTEIALTDAEVANLGGQMRRQRRHQKQRASKAKRLRIATAVGAAAMTAFVGAPGVLLNAAKSAADAVMKEKGAARTAGLLSAALSAVSPGLTDAARAVGIGAKASEWVAGAARELGGLALQRMASRAKMKAFLKSQGKSLPADQPIPDLPKTVLPMVIPPPFVAGLEYDEKIWRDTLAELEGELRRLPEWDSLTQSVQLFLQSAPLL